MNPRKPTQRERVAKAIQDGERQRADNRQSTGSQTEPSRQTASRQPADNRQTLKRRNLRLPPDYWDELERIASRDSRTISEVVREAVREYLRGH